MGGFFEKQVTLIGFSHANATSHFQWSRHSYEICSIKLTLLASVISEFFAFVFLRMWKLSIFVDQQYTCHACKLNDVITSHHVLRSIKHACKFNDVITSHHVLRSIKHACKFNDVITSHHVLRSIKHACKFNDDITPHPPHPTPPKPRTPKLRAQ